MSFMPSNQDNSIYLNPTSLKQNEDGIDKLDYSKATGP